MQKRQSCRWPGQPEKPPRKAPNKNAPSAPRRRGQRATAQTQRSASSADEHTTPAPVASSSKTRPSWQDEQAEGPIASGLRKRKRNATDVGDDEEEGCGGDVEIVEREAVIVANSGVAWSRAPEDGLSDEELVVRFLAELQEFRANMRVCNRDSEALQRTMVTTRRPLRVEVNAILAVQERGDEALNYVATAMRDVEEEEAANEDAAAPAEGGAPAGEPEASAAGGHDDTQDDAAQGEDAGAVPQEDELQDGEVQEERSKARAEFGDGVEDPEEDVDVGANA